MRCAVVVALLILTTCVPGPKLRPIDGSGRLPIDDILKVVRKNHDKLGRCYADGLGHDPRLAGSIRARFRIATNGTMESVEVLGTTLPDDRVVQCVIDEYKKLQFPSPDDGAAWAVYQIAFYSTNGAVSIIDSDLPNRDGESCPVGRVLFANQCLPGFERQWSCRTPELCMTRCDADDLQACLDLGIMYANSVELVKDFAVAAHKFRRACDGKIARACTYLGFLYSTGHGVATNMTRAADLYRIACEGGDLTGCYSLCVMYQRGDDLPKDENRALDLCQRVCDGGLPEGCISGTRGRPKVRRL